MATTKSKRPTVAELAEQVSALTAAVGTIAEAVTAPEAEAPKAPKARKARAKGGTKGGAKARAKVAIPEGMLPVRDPDSGRHVCYVGRDPQSGEVVAALCSPEGALSVAKGDGARHAFRVRKGFPDVALPVLAEVLAAEGVAAE